MKVLIAIFTLLIIISVFTLYGAGLEKVDLGTGNDMWTFGLSRNDDDMLSYSGLIDIETDKADIYCELQGITNRGWKDGWIPGVESSSDSPFYNGRYDSAIITASIDLEKKLGPIKLLSVPELGVQLVGKLGFDFFQNSSHKTLKVHGVEIPYDTDDISAHFYIKAENSITASLYEFDQSTIDSGAFFSFTDSVGFERNFYWGVTTALNRGNDRVMGLSFGLENTESLSDLRTEKLYALYRNGLKLNFFFDTGMLNISYESNINTGNGYTRVMMNVLPYKGERNWKESDISLGLGISYMMDNDLWTIRVSKPIGNSNLSIFAENRNISGYPIDQNEELSADLQTTGRYKKAYNFLMLGGKYSIKTGFFEFYTSLSAGFADFKEYELTNMLETSEVPFVNQGEAFTPAFDFSIGTTILPENLFINNYANYRVSVEAGATIFTSYDHIESIMKNDFNSDYKKLGTVIPKLSVFLEVGLDL